MLDSELIKLIFHPRAEEEGAYANVDSASATGLLRAAQLRFALSGLHQNLVLQV